VKDVGCIDITASPGLKSGAVTAEGLASNRDSRFKIGSASEALLPQPEIQWLFRDLLARRWVSMWFGEPGCKKTWAALDHGVCLAMGKPWLGFQSEPSKVLIVDEESGERRLRRRLGDVMRGHDAPADIPLYYTSLHGFNLMHEQGASELEELILQVKPDLVVIDALADLMLGGDENLVRDTQPVFARLRRIAEKHDCAFQIIHHVNRAGTYRGSSALKAATDSMLVIKSKPDSSIITFTTEKSRDTALNQFRATAHFDEGMFRLSIANPAAGNPRLSTSERLVLDLLSKGRQTTIKSIIGQTVDFSPATARRTLYRLARTGLIRRADRGGSGTEATYERV
jgi:hypothetical protein